MNYIAEWLDGYRRFWELRMERIEEYLRKLQDRDGDTAAALKDTGKGENDDGKR